MSARLDSLESAKFDLFEADALLIRTEGCADHVKRQMREAALDSVSRAMEKLELARTELEKMIYSAEAA